MRTVTDSLLNAKPLTLLVIDDDPIDRSVVRRAFKAASVESSVTEANDYNSALQLLAVHSFDCILLDYNLPDTDGMGVIGKLRQRGIMTPIVVLTGQGDERIAVRLMKAGATDYLTKDALSASSLVQSVRSAIRVQQAEIQAARASQESLLRLNFLAEASRLLAASLDRQTIIQQLAELAVPALADWCAIDIGDAPDQLARVLPPPDEPNAEPPEGAASALCIRITSRGTLHGALTLVRLEDQPASPIDMALAYELAQRAAIAFDNAQLYRQAREAIGLRDDFLSIASHELRTPLTSLLGYVQLLERRIEREDLLSERDRRAVRVVVEQATRLNKMISAMLDVSRLQSGQFSIHQLPVDLGAAAARLLEELKPSLNQHTILLHTTDEPLVVLGDEVRLHQVMQNLIQNAVKYSPPHSVIDVRLSQRPGWADLAISDDGIGIPAEAIPHLFSRFYRAANADAHQINGIGLGLYVVHEIVQLHGGRVSVESVVEQGSTFIVSLPLIDR
jgi:signal transduction histidine kinase